MIHTASLMHDDVVDESPVRRGKLTAAVACCAKLHTPWLRSAALSKLRTLCTEVGEWCKPSTRGIKEFPGCLEGNSVESADRYL